MWFILVTEPSFLGHSFTIADEFIMSFLSADLVLNFHT